MKKPITFTSSVKTITAVQNNLVAMGSLGTIKVTEWKWDKHGWPIIKLERDVWGTPLLHLALSRDSKYLYGVETEDIWALSIETGEKSTLGSVSGNVHGIRAFPEERSFIVYGENGLLVFKSSTLSYRFPPFGGGTIICAGSNEGKILCVTSKGLLLTLTVKDFKLIIVGSKPIPNFVTLEREKIPTICQFNSAGNILYITQFLPAGPYSFNLMRRYSIDQNGEPTLEMDVTERQGRIKLLAVNPAGNRFATYNDIGIRIRDSKGRIFQELAIPKKPEVGKDKRVLEQVTSLTMNNLHMYYGRSDGDRAIVLREFLVGDL